MIINLLLKFSSPKKTSKLTLCRSNDKSVRQAARHSSVAPGVYLFDQAVDIHGSHLEVQGLIGKKLLVFRRQGSMKKVYLYANPSNMIPLQDAIAVSVPDFMEICAGLAPFVTALEVQSTFFLWGSQPMRTEAIPPAYQQFFSVPLESFKEPSEEAKREEARRQEQALARKAQDRAMQARAAATWDAQQDAAKKAQRDADVSRQAAQARSKPSSPPPRPRAGSPARPAYPANRLVSSRNVSASRTSGSTTRYDDEDSLADFMFMSMFPDVAPLYRPNSFMAWYLWSQHHDSSAQPVSGAGGQFDGGGASGDWQQGVPGFPGAASQQVTPHEDGQSVQLLDANGRNVGSFLVSQNNGQTQFTTPDGHVFTVAGQSNPSIEYSSETGQRFYWDGTNEPVVGAIQDNDTSAPAASAQMFFSADATQGNDAGSDMGNSTSSISTFDSPGAAQSMDSNTAY